MELKEYLRIVFRRKWVIIIAAVAGLIVALIATLLTTPVYQATATLRVATVPTGSVESIYYDSYYSNRLMNTYARIATSAPMLADLEKELGTGSPTVKIRIVPDSELMEVTAEDESPDVAANAANALAKLLIESVRNMETEAGRVRATQSLRTNSLIVIDPAVIPDAPVRPRKVQNIALGLALGLLGGIGLAFVLENLDTTLNTTEQIEQVTQRHVLGKIPPIKQVNKLFLNSHTPGGDAFRHIRTSLLNFVPNDTPQTLLVTSAEAGEGKSTVAVNLAYALTQSRRKVLLIDCDMRLPTLHKILDVPNETGLSETLNGKKRLEEVRQFNTKIETWVVTSGIFPHNPADLLESDEMTEMLRQARQQFDLVILDAPALLAVTDAAVLASKVDAVLLVVDRSRTRLKAVKAASRLLESAKAKSVGVVINRSEPDGKNSYYYRKGQPN